MWHKQTSWMKIKPFHPSFGQVVANTCLYRVNLQYFTILEIPYWNWKHFRIVKLRPWVKTPSLEYLNGQWFSLSWSQRAYNVVNVHRPAKMCSSDITLFYNFDTFVCEYESLSLKTPCLPHNSAFQYVISFSCWDWPKSDNPRNARGVLKEWTTPLLMNGTVFSLGFLNRRVH